MGETNFAIVDDSNDDMQTVERQINYVGFIIIILEYNIITTTTIIKYIIIIIMPSSRLIAFPHNINHVSWIF
jgi:hypothetical protein